MKQKGAFSLINMGATESLALAIISLSFIPIFFRLLEEEVGPFATAFHRVWLATLLLGLWHGLRRLQDYLWQDGHSTHLLNQKNPYTPLVILQLLIAGGSFAGNQLLLAWSLNQTSIANTVVLTNMTPIWTAILGWLIWNKTFDISLLVGMGIALTGACVLGIEDWQLATGSLQGDASALFAALLNSTYILPIEALRHRLSSTVVLSWICIISSLCLFPIAFFSEPQIFPQSWLGWVWVILLGLICQLLGVGLVTYCLKNISAELVATGKLLLPIISAFLAWLCFGEILSFWNYVAFAVVLLGIYIAKSGAGLKTPTST